MRGSKSYESQKSELQNEVSISILDLKMYLKIFLTEFIAFYINITFI